jgi:hypothetical protein
MRGELTNKIKAKSKELLGYEITEEELRLMPYIQYQMMNEQRLDIAKISSSEREILSSWREKEYIDGGASGLAITKEFWDAINQILWIGYVAHEEE